MSIAIAVLVLGASTVLAQSNTAEKTAKGAQASAASTFVMHAAEGGRAEVELGKLALDKAAHADVKRFAQRMVDDHGKANEELKAIARSRNIAIPTEPSAKHKAVRDRLSKLSGAAFDSAYMRAMHEDHEKAVSEFRQASKSGSDSDVKAFAAKTLPTLEEHLKMARSTEHMVVGTSGTRSPAETGTAGTRPGRGREASGDSSVTDPGAVTGRPNPEPSRPASRP
jgi:putative membrane protein